MRVPSQDPTRLISGHLAIFLFSMVSKLLSSRRILNMSSSFSHHRVTVPPPGWVSAAHRQGVKILGTLLV